MISPERILTFSKSYTENYEVFMYGLSVPKYQKTDLTVCCCILLSCAHLREVYCYIHFPDQSHSDALLIQFK